MFERLEHGCMEQLYHKAESELRMQTVGLERIDEEFDYIESQINRQVKYTDIDTSHLSRQFVTARENVLLVANMFGDGYEALRQSTAQFDDTRFNALFAQFINDCLELAIERLEEAHKNLHGIYQTLDERDEELREAMSGFGDPVSKDVDEIDTKVFNVLSGFREIRRNRRDKLRESNELLIDAFLGSDD